MFFPWVSQDTPSLPDLIQMLWHQGDCLWIPVQYVPITLTGMPPPFYLLFSPILITIEHYVFVGCLSPPSCLAGKLLESGYFVLFSVISSGN